MNGEHVIIDRDRLIVLLKLIFNSGLRDECRRTCSEIVRSHAEQFKDLSLEEILERYKVYNLFQASS